MKAFAQAVEIRLYLRGRIVIGDCRFSAQSNKCSQYDTLYEEEIRRTERGEERHIPCARNHPLFVLKAVVAR